MKVFSLEPIHRVNHALDIARRALWVMSHTVGDRVVA